MKNAKPPNLSRAIAFYLFVCLLSLDAVTQPAPAQTEARRNIDWVFVLDTSASMVGADGAKNIFGDVKHTLTDFVRKTHEGDSVTLYTFANDTDKRRGTRLNNSEQDRLALIDEINHLDAPGTRTHTGKAIKDALETAGNLRKRADASTRTISIVLLSDGKEDTRGLTDAVSIPSNLKLIPEDPPYLFYVSLGESEPGIDEVGKALGPGHYEKSSPNNPQEIYDAIERIRKVSEKPPPPPPPPEINLRLEAAQTDFGQIEPGDQTARQTMKASSNVKTRARLTLKNGQENALSLVDPQETLDLKAEESLDVPVRMATAANLPDGLYTARLVLSPVDAPASAKVTNAEVKVQVNVARVPVWRRALKWLALALLLLLLALVAVSIVKGEPPWIWLGGLKADKYLEGEIEVLKPRPAQAEDEFISLLKRETQSINLSALVPDGAAADADAELVAVRRNKQKTMQLRRTQGVVRVNNTEIVTIELFDGDVIDLGDARLRFNWIGHDRPETFEGEEV
jgi:hypothetical protein